MCSSIETVRIRQIGGGSPVTYAVLELRRCLEQAFSIQCNVTTEHEDNEPAILVATANALASVDFNDPIPEPDMLHDEIAVDVSFAGGAISGFICGSNERSVLIAVYQLLFALGYRWVRPGTDGELVPRSGVPRTRVRLSERASYAHRGVCIEGAAAYEHVRDIIEWLPRVGMNAYFIQFREAHTFFDRWYRHLGNPIREAEPFAPNESRALIRRLTDEIKMRGLLYHAVGHGWTCEPFGIPGLAWERYDHEIPDSVRRYFAKMNGRRDLFHGIPLDTNLCYSNADARGVVVDAIVTYAAEHPEVTYLHVWLADGINNHCECEECVKRRPADFYVILLNEIDEALGERGIPTKIVFLIYVDLLWPPETERLHRPDRFVLMFAPITRSYTEPFSADEVCDVRPFVRNELEFPVSPAENVAYLRSWQGLFAGDSFDFDYHLFWAHYLDPGSMRIARVLHADLRNLKAVGLGGYMSCQVQRAAFPVGLPLYTLAATLWNRDRDFDEICSEYFSAALGALERDSRIYLEHLSEIFDGLHVVSPFQAAEAAEADGAAETGGRSEPRPGEAADYDEARRVIGQFLRRLKAAGDTPEHHDPNGCRSASIRYLELHGKLTADLALALAARARGDRNAALELWEKVKAHAWKIEEEAHTVFDAHFYTKVLERTLFPALAG